MSIRVVLSALMVVAVTGRLTADDEPSELLKIGDVAPELSLDKVLRIPAGDEARMSALRGKVVVLTFWGPHARPCAAAFDYLNELAKALEGKPVQFIAIAAVDEDVAQRYTEMTPIAGWIGLDVDMWTFRAYSAGRVPHTVVVDTQGFVAAITKPQNVTEAVVRDLLAGKTISLPEKKGRKVKPIRRPDKKDVEEEPLYEVYIAPVEMSPMEFGMRIDREHGGLTGKAVPLTYLVSVAYDMRLSCIINKLPNPEQLYRVSIRTPNRGEEAMQELLRDTIKKAFNARVRRHKEGITCLALRRIEGRSCGLKATRTLAGKGFIAPGSVYGKAMTAANLASQLEGLAGLPVFDETGLTGKYDYKIDFSLREEHALEKALSERGLELTPVLKEMDVLVIEPALRR